MWSYIGKMRFVVLLAGIAAIPLLVYAVWLDLRNPKAQWLRGSGKPSDGHTEVTLSVKHERPPRAALNFDVSSARYLTETVFVTRGRDAVVVTVPAKVWRKGDGPPEDIGSWLSGESLDRATANVDLQIAEATPRLYPFDSYSFKLAVGLQGVEHDSLPADFEERYKASRKSQREDLLQTLLQKAGPLQLPVAVRTDPGSPFYISSLKPAHLGEEAILLHEPQSWVAGRVTLKRSLVLRLAFLLLYAPMALVLIQFLSLKEHGQVIGGALGYLGALWGIRAFLGGGLTDFPTLVDLTTLVLACAVVLKACWVVLGSATGAPKT